jgi:hypothetical protein
MGWNMNFNYVMRRYLARCMIMNSLLIMPLFICNGAMEPLITEKKKPSKNSQSFFKEQIYETANWIHNDLINRFNTLSWLMQQKNGWQEIINAPVDTAALYEEEKIFRRYFQKIKYEFDGRFYSDNDNPHLKWNALICAWERLKKWYIKKLFVLEKFSTAYQAAQKTPLHCNCSAAQANFNHDEITMYVDNMSIDEIALVDTNMITFHGRPTSTAKALWFIPFCFRSNLEKPTILTVKIILTEKKAHRLYRWLVPSFNSTNLELMLLGPTTPDTDPKLSHFSESNGTVAILLLMDKIDIQICTVDR